MVALRRTVERLVWPLRRRVMLMVGRAVLALVDDDPQLQVLQVRALRGETIDRAERFQQYGFTGVPEEGAEVVVVCPGGIRQHPLVIAVDDRRHRPTGLRKGEVCVYTREDTEDNPHRLIMKQGRVAELHGDEILLSAAGGASTISMDARDVLVDSPHIGLND